MYQPDTYVEVGLQKGYTFKHIAPMVTRAIGIDKKLLFSNIDLPNSTLYESDSIKIAKNWTDGAIDLLFIDGDHREKSVLADVDAFLPYVRPCTGLILLHDTYPSIPKLEADGYSSTAGTAARKIHKSPKYKNIEIVTLPGPYAGLSILRKATQHLHWKNQNETS